MKLHTLSHGLCATALVCCISWLAAAAQSPKPVPRTADGHPDLSGMWVERLPNDPNPAIARAARPPAGADKRVPAAVSRYPSDELPYQPWAAQKARELHDAATTDPLLHCLPYGEPRIWGGPHPAQIIQLPGEIVILYERDTAFRVIPTNKAHEPDPDPSWMGDSVAKWDGDALVVDVIGLTDKSWLGSGKNAGEGAGTFHTDALHVTERISRPDFDHLTVQITDDDPKVFTKPWTYAWNMKRTEVGFYEDVTCSNEKDLAHEVPETSTKK